MVSFDMPPLYHSEHYLLGWIVDEEQDLKDSSTYSHPFKISIISEKNLTALSRSMLPTSESIANFPEF